MTTQDRIDSDWQAREERRDRETCPKCGGRLPDCCPSDFAVQMNRQAKERLRHDGCG